MTNGDTVKTAQCDGHTEQENTKHDNPKMTDGKFICDEIGDDRPDQGFDQKRCRTDSVDVMNLVIFHIFFSESLISMIKPVTDKSPY